VLAGTMTAEPIERGMPSGDQVTESPALRSGGGQISSAANGLLTNSAEPD
jgi:hypothetical protein